MLLETLVIALFSSSASALTGASTIAKQYSLTSSTTFPTPTAVQNSTGAVQFITSKWGTYYKSIPASQGANDLAFVTNPFPNSTADGLATNTSGLVLQVTYPAGSYSNNTGGAQFYSLWNKTSSGTAFNSMMLQYEVAFDHGYNWVMGGKLPGIRGGPAVSDCSGGNQANGSDCFSSRIMWRTNGAGEDYSYVPYYRGWCNSSNIICNPDFGTSIHRGSFTFASGQWNKITMMVQMNNPHNVSNGNLLVYFNDNLVIQQQNILYRNSSKVSCGGMFFSTFFGGNDNTWATPTTQHSYFRNFKLWGGSGYSKVPV